jgi:transposase-like protein
VLGRRPKELHELLLTGVLRESARQLLARGIEAEVRYFREGISRPGNGSGRDPLVRNGLHPERTVMTGIGPVAVRLPKVRRRETNLPTFRSMLVSRYARRARTLSAGSLASYLHAIESGDIGHALAALIGPQAHAVPAPVKRELQDWWAGQCATWRTEIARLDTPNLTPVALTPIVATA